MRARADEHLGGGGVFSGTSGAPCPAVHEDLNMRSRSGCVDVELLVGARAVGEALRLAQAPARRLGSEVAAFEQLVTVRRVHRLVVGVVERFLIVVAKNRLHCTGSIVKDVELVHAAHPRAQYSDVVMATYGGRHGQGWKKLSAVRGR